jgi:dynein heavy chain
MTQATIEVYEAVTTQLLPTPSKSHYVFNLRDMSKIFQGLLQVSSDSFDTQDSMVKLWVHECFRVFHDRLVEERDRAWFRNLIQDKLVSLFGVSWQKLYRGSNTPAFFGSFMNDEKLYQVTTNLCNKAGHDTNCTCKQELPFSENLDALRSHLQSCIEEFNVEPGNVPMDLVLFKDAINHICRIHRLKLNS